METQEQETYASLIRYLDWKDFPESEMLKTKALIEVMDLSEISDENGQQLISILSDMAQKEHLDLSTHRWDSFLETMNDIWLNTPQAFGRFFLEWYYRNNDSPFGDVLRNLLRSTCPDENELSYSAWLVIGELTIFQLSHTLAETIYESKIESGEHLQRKNSSLDPRKKQWFLPGPIMGNLHTIFPFPDEKEDGFEEMLAFFAIVLKPGSNVTKLMTIEYEANFHQFNRKSDYKGDIRYEWSDETISKFHITKRFIGYIEEDYLLVEQKLCQLLIEKYQDIHSLLMVLQQPDSHNRNTIFKQEINQDNPYVGAPLLTWWDQVKENASGKKRQEILKKKQSSLDDAF